MTNFKITRALVLSVVCSASRSTAQSPGTFTATGNMTTARSGHTAILLTNGKVLIAGGSSANLASAELYDPASGTFTRTGDMTTPRARPTSTLLPDGRVLIASGLSTTASAGVANAELYDPASGTFVPTGNMIQSGGYFRTALLPTGKVLIVKGLTAELYDPSSATFTTVGPLPFIADQITLLADGKVLMQGSNDEDVTFDLALFDPVTGAVSLAAPIRAYLPIVTATLLTTGKVLDTWVIGYGFPTDVAQLYDPSSGMFAPRRMTAMRRYATATLLPDATVLIAGGGDASPPYYETHSAELYDPVTDNFSRTGSMTENREGHTATLLANGTVLVAGGGINARGTVGAEIYHPNVLIPAPVLFSLSGDGRGAGAIWDAQTGQIASAGNPAVAGEVLSMYTTSLVDSGVIPPQITVGGRLAEVLYFGVSSYRGYNQVNFRVPTGVAPGPAVLVRLTYLGRSSNEVIIGVR